MFGYLLLNVSQLYRFSIHFFLLSTKLNSEKSNFINCCHPFFLVGLIEIIICACKCCVPQLYRKCALSSKYLFITRSLGLICAMRSFKTDKKIESGIFVVVVKSYWLRGDNSFPKKWNRRQ